MDLLNQTLNSFSTQIAGSSIFEANLGNLVLLNSGIFYLLSGILSESLASRESRLARAYGLCEKYLDKAREEWAIQNHLTDYLDYATHLMEVESDLLGKKTEKAALIAVIPEIDRLYRLAEKQRSVLESRVVTKILSTVVLNGYPNLYDAYDLTPHTFNPRGFRLDESLQ